MARRHRALGVLTLLALSTACAPDARRPPNVLIVVIDALRADRLGAYGNRRGLTPFLDALAQRGTLFEHAYAVSSWTIPSVASLFTSRYPTQHHVITYFSVLQPEEVTLAERLRDAGWSVAGFSANPNLRKDRGYGQGFDKLWIDLSTQAKVPGDALRGKALSWSDRRWPRRGRTPAMLFLQYMEPHEPYEAPEPFRSRFVVDDDGRPFDMEGAIREAIAIALPGAGLDDAAHPPDVNAALRELASQGKTVTAEMIAPLVRLKDRMNSRLYDAGVAAADDQVRRLFGELERRGFLDDTIVVLTSDHGEEFRDHGGTSHGRSLYEEQVRVPLILVGPGIPAGRRIEENVSLLDLAPTLLDLLGLDPEQRFEGRSLVPLVRTGAARPAAGASPNILLQLEPALPVRMDPRVHSRALVSGRQKLLVGLDGSSELYDLAADPGETRSGPATLAGQEQALSEQLSLAEARLGPSTPRSTAPAPLDEAQKRRLRALGYTP